MYQIKRIKKQVYYSLSQVCIHTQKHNECKECGNEWISIRDKVLASC